MRRPFAALLLALLALTVMGAQAAFAALSTGISGVEASAGFSCGPGKTCGATFLGWTDSAGTWVPPNDPTVTRGAWSAVINYTGSPGLGSHVDITGGTWSLSKSGTTLAGRVKDGLVTWPQTGGNLGCGTDIATFTATLRALKGTSGTINGCLDDTHLSTVFPPHMWGQLSLN
jgi:hypothetical protein